MTKQTAKKTTKKRSNDTVAYEPNKMTVAIATLSVVLLVLLAVIVTFS